MILDGECDSILEQAFYMAGSINDVLEKAKAPGGGGGHNARPV
jgi:F0F1-type ATP synthase beta subunit